MSIMDTKSLYQTEQRSARAVTVGLQVAFLEKKGLWEKPVTPVAAVKCDQNISDHTQSKYRLPSGRFTSK